MTLLRTLSFALPLVVALAATGRAEPPDRSHNSAPVAKAFPKSLMPKLDRVLLGKLEGQDPFDDKLLEKLAVVGDWSAWYVADDGIQTQDLTTAVGVYDPQNKKCWLWGAVIFVRQRGDSRILYEQALSNPIHEIDCALLK